MRLGKFWVLCGLLFSAAIIGCGGGGGTTPPPATLTITTSGTLPVGVVSSVYGPVTISATGGTAPYMWSGTPPAGLSLSSAGVLSGTPTAAGTTSFTIQAKDSASTPQTATLSATLTINAALAITTTSPLPSGLINSAYSTTLAASGGVTPYTWSLASGSAALPAGLSLSSAGVLSGTPTAAFSGNLDIQVADSETTAQTVKQSFMLTISPALAITTTSLPAGTQNVAYPSTTLTAVGGVPPYTWGLAASGGLLPTGLNVNTAGVISGTPTTIAATSPIFVVTDSSNAHVTQTIPLVVNPPKAAAPIPDGTYAFLFGATAPQGTSNTQTAIMFNGAFTTKSGTVLSGYYDENGNDTAPTTEQTITGGSLTYYSNGLGQLVLQTGGGNVTFALAIPPSSVTGSDAPIRIIGFDDTNGTGTRGSGVLKPAAATPSLPTTASSFAFLFSGANLSQQQQALEVSFKTDGNGNIVSLRGDANQLGGSHGTWDEPVIANEPWGTYSLDAKGRGLLTFYLGGSTPGGTGSTAFHFSFYEVSPTEWLAMSVDPASTTFPLAEGPVLQQSGPFTTATIPATSVVEASGLAPVSTGVVPDILLGLVTNTSGALNFTYDEYTGALATGQTLAASFTVDGPTGRTTSTTANTPILYQIDSTRAFIVFFPQVANGSQSPATSGIIEQQAASSFGPSSFSGSYLGGSLPLGDPSVLNEAGLVTADGAGNVTYLTNRSTSSGLTEYDTVTGTYTVGSNGEVTVTTPDGLTRIFYIVSPTKVAYLTSDGGGYLGTFQQ
jgi:hypothetical protein